MAHPGPPPSAPPPPPGWAAGAAHPAGGPPPLGAPAPDGPDEITGTYFYNITPKYIISRRGAALMYSQELTRGSSAGEHVSAKLVPRACPRRPRLPTERPPNFETADYAATTTMDTLWLRQTTRAGELESRYAQLVGGRMVSCKASRDVVKLDAQTAHGDIGLRLADAGDHAEHGCSAGGGASVEGVVDGSVAQLRGLSVFEGRVLTHVNGVRVATAQRALDEVARTQPLEEDDQGGAKAGALQVELRFAAGTPPAEATEASAKRRRVDRTEGGASDAMQAMWSERKFCDCTVRSRCGATFDAHRVVLSARLPHFDALFSSGMKEAQERVADVDADAAEVEALLRYLYTAELRGDCDAAALLAVAHHHDVRGLVEACAERIAAALAPGNAVATVRCLRPYCDHACVAPAWRIVRAKCRGDPALFDPILESV